MEKTRVYAVDHFSLKTFCFIIHKQILFHANVVIYVFYCAIAKIVICKLCICYCKNNLVISMYHKLILMCKYVKTICY